jgi:hypothetical protein
VEPFSPYEAMTVNERLFAAGLLARWDAAVRRRHRGEMVALLRRVDLTPEQAAETSDAVLASPRKYGF